MYLLTPSQLGSINATSTNPASIQRSSPSCQLPMWRLEYEGSPEKNQCIKIDDIEFQNNYVNRNIVDSTAKVDIMAGKILRWEIRYKDGRIKLLDANVVPVIKGARPRGVGISLISHYLKKTDGFIYPIYNGTIRYDWIQTPTLIEMRNQLDTKLKALRKLRMLMFLTAIFAGAVSASAKGISSIQTISGKPLKPTNLELLEQLAK